jgi:transposase-like protein
MTKRGEVSRRRSASEWRTLILVWEASGESLERFCRRQGIRPSTLKWWRWRLRDSGHAKPESPGSAPSLGTPQFAELCLQEPAESAGEAGGFELRWSDGLTLRIPCRFDELSLRRLLVVLEATGC